MLNKTTGSIKIIILTLSIFIVSSASLYISCELFWGITTVPDINIRSSYSLRFMGGHLYFFTVYLIISFVYAFSFYYVLKLDKTENLRKVSSRLYMIGILFLSGLALYAINKYYWQRWVQYDFWLWWLTIFLKYLLFLASRIGSIFFWIVPSALITYLIALDDEAKAVAKRPLWILLALYAIFFAFIPSLGVKPIEIACAIITTVFVLLIVWYIHKQIKSRQALRIQQRPSEEANASVSATNGDLNATTAN